MMLFVNEIKLANTQNIFFSNDTCNKRIHNTDTFNCRRTPYKFVRIVDILVCMK